MASRSAQIAVRALVTRREGGMCDREGVTVAYKANCILKTEAWAHPKLKALSTCTITPQPCVWCAPCCSWRQPSWRAKDYMPARGLSCDHAPSAIQYKSPIWRGARLLPRPLCAPALQRRYDVRCGTNPMARRIQCAYDMRQGGHATSIASTAANMF